MDSETDIETVEEAATEAPPAADPLQAELTRVGEQTAGLLRSAGETAAIVIADAERQAADTTAQAEAEAAATRAEAEEFAQAVRGSAYSFSQEHRREAEADAERLVSEAQAEADRIAEVASVRRSAVQSDIDELAEHRDSIVAELERLAESAWDMASRHRPEEPKEDEAADDREVSKNGDSAEWHVTGPESEADADADDPLDRLRAEIEQARKPVLPESAPPPASDAEKSKLGAEYEPRGGRFSAFLPPRRRKQPVSAKDSGDGVSKSASNDSAEAPTSSK